jgi:hypothetical protein
VRELREVIDELVSALVVFDPALFAGGDCAALAEGLARAANACQAAGARAAARAVECGHSGAAEDATAFDWLARVGGTTAGAMRSALCTVDRLDTCPATRASVLTGEVSLRQATEIVSVPDCEEELLAVARASGLRAVKDRARKRRCERIKPEELHARQRAARRFSHWRDALGMVRFRGALPPEEGIPFVNRVDAEANRQWRAARREKREETPATLAADAFVAVTRDVGTRKSRPRSAELVLVVDLNAYRRGHAHAGEPCHVIGGGPIPVAVAREMACDAFLKAVLHDGVNVHTVAHFRRHRKAELETALRLGAPPDFDGVTCSEPECDRRYGLEWDHVDPLANGGPTQFANLKAKCKPHHRAKTERDRAAGLLAARAAARAP